MNDQPECLTCGRELEEWGICPQCRDEAEVRQAMRKDRISMGLEGRCWRCGSVFASEHRCAM